MRHEGEVGLQLEDQALTGNDGTAKKQYSTLALQAVTQPLLVEPSPLCLKNGKTGYGTAAHAGCVTNTVQSEK